MNYSKESDKMLRAIAQKLDITNTQFEKAKKSYNAVGEYLNNNIDGNINIFPQGSFRLGIIIKPLSDNDDYDIDLVCIINNNINEPKELKDLVGNVLKNSDRYNELLEKEGKRCWTLKYSDDAQYHMDILPAIKDYDYSICKTLKITNKDEKNNKYTFVKTNPEAYYEWFKIQCEKESESRDIEEIEKYDYTRKTTLQRALQILKRYRDVKFEKELENKPISIILTTIMGKLYDGENNIFELLVKFANFAENYIEDRNGIKWIENPVNKFENFADKWQIHPEREKAFYRFILELKKDIKDIEDKKFDINNDDLYNMTDNYKKMFGESLVEKAYNYKLEFDNKKTHIDENLRLNSKNKGERIPKHSFYGQ